MKPSQVLDIIWDINDEIEAEHDGSVNLLQFWSNGEDSSVTFLNQEIWSSDMDDIDNIESFLKQECNRLIDKLNKQKFGGINEYPKY